MLSQTEYLQNMVILFINLHLPPPLIANQSYSYKTAFLCLHQVGKSINANNVERESL